MLTGAGLDRTPKSDITPAANPEPARSPESAGSPESADSQAIPVAVEWTDGGVRFYQQELPSSLALVALTSLILGIGGGLHYGVELFGGARLASALLHRAVHAPTDPAMTAISLAVAAAMAAGGIGLLRSREWGRRLLLTAAASAVPVAIVGAVLAWRQSESLHRASGDSVHTAVFLGLVCFTALKVGYGALVIRQLTTTIARESMF